MDYGLGSGKNAKKTERCMAKAAGIERKIKKGADREKMAREDTTFDKMPKEAYIALSKKGGRASGAARRRKKSMREWAEVILNSREVDAEKVRLWQEAGIDDEMTKMAAIVLNLCNMAAEQGKDSIAAYREIQNLLGEEAFAAAEGQATPDIKERARRVLAVLECERTRRGME